MNIDVQEESFQPSKPTKCLEDIPRRPGSYILILEIVKDITVNVGSLGIILFKKGFYMYIGSARGPGGLRARLTRHLKGPSHVKWHIDYLTSKDEVKTIAVVVSETSLDVEEAISKEMLRQKCVEPGIKGFGSSDKRSVTHLFSCTCSLQECVKVILGTLSNLALEPQLVPCNPTSTSYI